jgi:hypothetical protein
MDSILLSGDQVHLRDWLMSDLEAFAYWLQTGHQWQALDGPYLHTRVAQKRLRLL